tara:strand:+ start:49 stop:582 length:534 start_codon:yes stop_codon:yes gene_type:complete
MRDEPINPDGVELPKMIVPRVCVGIILLVWVLSGFSKVSDMTAFVNTVEEHNVLPQDLFGLMWWVGPGELVLGLLLVFAMGSELTKFFGRAVLVISMLMIAAFTYYLSLVSDAVLLESGCGCLKLVERINFGIDENVRTVKYAMNGGLILLHLIALFGPVSIMRAHRKKLAAAEADA